MARTTSNKSRTTGTTDGNIVLNHLQPQAVEIEEAILGALMIDVDAYNKVSDIITADSFYDNRNKTIYSAINTLFLNQRPIDILTVIDQVNSMGKLDEVGGAVYISLLANKVTSSSHIEYHAKIVAQKAMAREIISFSSEIQTMAFDSTTDIDELLHEAEGKIFNINKKNIKRDFSTFESVLTEAIDRLTQATKKADGTSGVRSGFTKLDDITSGWQKTDLIILAARPAMGKTAFALSMAKNIAINNQIPVAFFSLEMANVQLVNRLISSICEIPASKLRDGRLAPYEWAILEQKIGAIQNAPLYLDDTPSLSISEFRSKAMRLRSEHNVELIIIDYLQLMTASGMRFGNRQEEISTISRNLKAIAKELNIPIIALSQLNRSVDSRDGGYEGKRPQLNDLRESGAIEQDADIVCFIHRPEYYKIYEDPEHNDLHGIAEIIIAKHRNGGIGDIRLAFRSELALFDNIGSDSYKSRINQNHRASDITPIEREDNLENDPLGAEQPTSLGY